MDISYVGDLNDHITKEGISNILLVQEALQEAKISDIAQRIVLEGNKKFICLLYTSSGEIVLSRVVIPEYIVVHDGSVNDTTAPDYYERYKDYIKNVASSEISVSYTHLGNHTKGNSGDS